MIGATKLLTALSRLAKHTRADGVSLCAHAKRRRVFRFAYGAIHQSLEQDHITVTVNVVRRQRIGVASTDTLERDGLARCVNAAIKIAEHAPQHRDLPLLARGHRVKSTSDFIPATARISPTATASLLKSLHHLCQGAGAALAGSLVTGIDEFAVVNSAGTSCYAASTIAGAKLVTMYGKLSGYASAVSRDIEELNLPHILKRSLSQSLHRRDPVTIPLGTYEVILEPEAVGDLVTWLGYTAFGAKSVQERTSFLAGRLGDHVMDSQITIYDDGNEPEGLRMPFDFEGTPKEKIVLIDHGRAAGIVYDSIYGARFGHPSTGHAMSPDETDGPLPLHLAMAPGRADLPQMIRACQRGLLIPRFHYVNGLLNPREALMTGLTREGAFLIENGKLAAPITTLRFTQSLLEALSRVLGVSKERRLVADPSQELGCAIMPTVHLATFKFTGRSDR